MNPAVSIVVPVYRNASTLRELHARIVSALGSTWSYEIVFVNDACPHGSLEVLALLAETDRRITIVSQPRNGGQNRAVLAGMKRARGSAIVVMDADLQDPPEAVPLLLQTFASQSGGVVFAGRRGTYQSRARMMTSHALRRLRSVLLRAVPRDAGLFVAMERAVAYEVTGYDDREPYVVAMIGRTGALMTSVPVVRARNQHGASGYSEAARLRLGWHALAGTLRTRFANDKTGVAT